MKPHIVALMSSIFLAGCNVPAWGNLFVLAVTLALFCATLSLGRHIAPPNDQGNTSDSETVRN